MDYGEGRHVYDVEGNRYLDFFGGILTTSLGYDIPEVTEAINKQSSKVLHSSTLYLSEPMIELAELVTELSGSQMQKFSLLLLGQKLTMQPCCWQRHIVDQIRYLRLETATTDLVFYRSYYIA